MKFKFFLIAFSALLRKALAVHDDGLGLGISLSSGYATISVYHANGTYTDIAKIEGGERYKAYMLGHREEPSAGSVATRYCPFSRDMCQRYWPITTIVQPPNPLAPILRALIVAGESMLGESIHSAAVSAYDFFPIHYDLAERDVQSALSGVQIDSWNRIDNVVTQLVFALGMEAHCSGPWTSPDHPSFHEDPEKLILSVEYTRQSLVAALWKEDCDFILRQGVVHANEFGHDARKLCQRTNDSASCDAAFKNALLDVVRSQKSMDGTHQRIDAVLVMGEQANDDSMVTLLRQVLKEQFSNGESADLSLVQDFAFDPAYVGSRASALAEWKLKDDVRDREQYLAQKEL